MTSPNVEELLGRLARVTIEFVKGATHCAEAAEFLSPQRRAKYVASLCPDSSDEELLICLYECLACVQQGLKVFVDKEFSQDYLEELKKYPATIYEEFFDAFFTQVETDCFPDIARAIRCYGNAVLAQIGEIQ